MQALAVEVFDRENRLGVGLVGLDVEFAEGFEGFP